MLPPSLLAANADEDDGAGPMFISRNALDDTAANLAAFAHRSAPTETKAEDRPKHRTNSERGDDSGDRNPTIERWLSAVCPFV
jgi:hypothetical protein